MANGQQKAQQNLDAFEAWAATQSDEDFKQIINQGKLHRGEIAKAIGCSRSALTQNPKLKRAVERVENELRDRGISPPLTQEALQSVNKPKKYDNTASRRALDSKRLSSLEAENIELKGKVTELENKLKRFGELNETLAELGFMPR